MCASLCSSTVDGLQTLIKHSLNSTHEEYNFDQFQDLMGSLDDRVTKIRKTQFYPCKYTKHASSI